MNWYKHYIGDFQRDTGHLSLTERGAYRALLDHHYATERPLPKRTDELCRIVGAVTKAERQAVQRVLDEFWDEGPDGWSNGRAQREMGKADHQRDVNRATAQQREARRRGRQAGHEQSTNRATNDQPNQTPDTRHHKDREESLGKGGAGGSAQRRGARLPHDWSPGEQGLSEACGAGLSRERVELEVAKFRDYWAAQPGQRGVKLDWSATWRNWCRKAAEQPAPRSGNQALNGETPYQRQMRERMQQAVPAIAARAPTAPCEPRTAEIIDVAARRLG